MKTVCIEMADDGSLAVGIEPEAGMTEGAPGIEADKSYMQPVASIDEALKMASQLLAVPAADGASPFDEQNMQQGFNKARGPAI